MDFKELKSLGLAEKEARVYLASLELGQDTVQNIAEKAKVNRATTYVVIESLMEKGLMSTVQEGKKQYFYAESPERLTILFREQALEIQRKQEQLDKILPELRSLNNKSNDKPLVRYFKGKDGLIGLSEEMFFNNNNDDTIRGIYSYDLLLKMFSEEEIVALRKKRINRKVKSSVIVNDDNKRLAATDAHINRIKSGECEITSDIAILGDKVRMITQKGQIGALIIENKEISNTLRVLFDLAQKYLDGKR